MLATKLEAAFHLADHGLSVVPIDAGDKKPCIPWGKYQTQKPTNDELKQWFVNFPHRNVGIVTGAGSGVVVLDVDKPDAFYLEMPRTPTVRTGRGTHYYFRHPGTEIGNASLPFGDLRGDGGLVVAPPSKHPNGSEYEWLVSFDEATLADLPASILELLKKPDSSKVDRIVDCETTPYGKTWLKDVEAFANCKEGNRNNQLNILACKAASLHAGGQLNKHEAWSQMMHASKKNGLWNDKGNGGARKVDETIRSGWKEGLKNPRYPIETEIVVHVESKPGKLNLVRLSDVQSEKIAWIWPGVLAKGKLALIAGQGGVGKSTLVSDLAARFTRGKPFPVSKSAPDKCDVLIIQLEEGTGDTVKPHILAAGGDPERVLVLSTIADEETGTNRPIDLRGDFAAIAEMVKSQPEIGLIIIDPIMGYMGNLNPDKATEVRKIMTPLQLLAEESNASILIVAHTNKSENVSAINSVQGSGAFIQAVRTAFVVYKDKDDNDRRVMAPLKNNLAKDDQSYSFRIESRQVHDNGLTIETGAVAWEAESHRGTADDALQSTKGGPAVREAREFLAACLGNGPRPYKTVQAESKELGISPATLYRARDDLGIVSTGTNDMLTWGLPQAF